MRFFRRFFRRTELTYLRTLIIQTGSEESGELFYMFYKAQNKVPHIVDDTPILIWLNGGPGCSSMIGNFYEIGPQRVNDQGVLIDFEHTWNKYVAQYRSPLHHTQNAHKENKMRKKSHPDRKVEK